MPSELDLSHVARDTAHCLFGAICSQGAQILGHFGAFWGGVSDVSWSQGASKGPFATP